MKNHTINNQLTSIVCPCFNEEDVLDLFFEKVSAILLDQKINYEFVCINDGSTDNSLETLLLARQTYPTLRIINLSRNFGKEAAISAGIDYAKGDCIIFMDIDLQDPPELIPNMLSEYKKGFDVVLARRTDRLSDTKSKRISAELFYKFHNLVSDVKIPENVGDFRLISRRVADSIKSMPENQRFMKGIFAWVGFKTSTIEYHRQQRAAGKSKFNAWSLWNFAIQGITSFSSLPLQIWTYLGMLISGLSLIFGIFIMIRTLLLGVDLPGYASIMVTILFLGGIQLISIGVLGEYIARIYMETKKRPNYIVENEYQ